MFSLNCPYYSKEFLTLEELIEDILFSGMDPNYPVLEDGEPTGEMAWNLIQI